MSGSIAHLSSVWSYRLFAPPIRGLAVAIVAQLEVLGQFTLLKRRLSPQLPQRFSVHAANRRIGPWQEQSQYLPWISLDGEGLEAVRVPERHTPVSRYATKRRRLSLKSPIPAIPAIVFSTLARRAGRAHDGRLQGSRAPRRSRRIRRRPLPATPSRPPPRPPPCRRRCRR